MRSYRIREPKQSDLRTKQKWITLDKLLAKRIITEQRTIAALFESTFNAVGSICRMSEPMINGAANKHHIENWVCCSTLVNGI
jgi:hypothetical protein